jgi:hypothetical protein
MTYDTHASNPFMLMLNPEVVIAAMEASERLKALNSHQCRPLDKIVPSPDDAAESADAAQAQNEELGPAN